MADPWDSAPIATPVDIALDAEGAAPQVAAVARSIYQQESGSGKNTKTSNAGAVGGMQIIPSTFHSVADKGWDIKDPVDNARAGVRYIQQMAEKAGGDPALTAAGYYGGPGAIDKARQGIAVSDPRNPNAPNTLQYGAQVAARIPQDTGGGDWWSQAPVVGDPQDPQTAPQDQTQATPQAAPQQPAQAAPSAVANVPGTADNVGPPVSAKNPSLLESLANAASHPVDTASNIGSALANGAVDLGHRFVDSPLKTTDDAIRGVADTLSFGTADKLAALVASQKNGTSYEDELLKQREQDKAGGSAFTAGQLAGGVLPVSAPIAAARLVPTASTAARVGAGMLAGGAEGAANYLGHSDGPVDAGDLATSAGLGTVLGALPGATMGPTENQLASTFIRKAGGAENAQRDAEIIQGLQGLASRTTQGDAKLGPADANALAARYTQTAADALRQMDKSPERQTLLNALDRTRSMSDDDINALRQLPNGGAVADAIQMRQRALSMTAPTPANSNMLMQGARMAVDNLVPYAPLRHFAINALGGRENRTGNISAALEQAQAAQAALNRLGPSQASQSAQTLAQASLSAQQARLQATQAAQAAAGTRQGVNQFQRGMAAAAQARQAASAGQAQGQQVFQAGQQAAQQARVQNAAAQAQAAAQARSQMANAMQGGAQLRQQAAQAAAPVQADLVAQQKAAQAAQAAQAKEVLKTQAAQRAALAETQASDPTYLLGMSSQFGPPRNPQEMAEFSKLMQNQAQSTTVGPQLPTQKAQAVKAAQVAQAQQAQAAASNVAQGNFQGLDTAHPRLQSMLQFVGSPSAPARAADVLPTLSALAQKDPVMGQKIAQMLSPGAKKLDPASFYGIQQALQASHGNRMEQALAERAAQAAPQAAQTAAPALAQATGDIQNPLAYKAGIANRQTVQKSALAAAQDPEVKKLITKMSTTSKAETRAELFNDFMKGKPAPQQLEAKRLAEPLITYGK